MPRRILPLVTSLCLAALLLPATASAQQEPSTEKPIAKPRTVIKRTQFIEPSELTEVLSLFHIEVATQPEISAVVLRGPADDIEAALKVIESLDTPPIASSTIELTVHVLAASEEPIANPRLPSELNPIVEQLSELFGYAGFQLLETTFLRATDGGHGRLLGGLKTPNDKTARYTLTFDRVKTVNRHADEPPIVRFKSFHFQYQQDSHSASLNTDFEMPVDRRVVLGRATPSGLSQALILIAEAKVSDGS